MEKFSVYIYICQHCFHLDILAYEHIKYMLTYILFVKV